MCLYRLWFRLELVITKTGNHHRPPQTTINHQQTTTNHHKPTSSDHKPPANDHKPPKNNHKPPTNDYEIPANKQTTRNGTYTHQIKNLTVFFFFPHCQAPQSKTENLGVPRNTCLFNDLFFISKLYINRYI